MPEKRLTRGVRLPSLWQACVVIAAMAGTWILWSEFIRSRQPPEIGSGQPDPGAKLRSILELSHQGESALDELTALLLSDDRTTRRNALLALAEMGPEARQALAAIRERFADEDSMVRQTALSVFSRICDDQDQSLAAAAGFLADPEIQMREQAARMLQTAGPAAISPLVAMAHSESADARQFVVRLLPEVDKQRDSDEVNAVLRSLLDDPDGTVRLQAIKAVVGRGAASIDEIHRWLRDEHPQLAAEGLRGIGSLGPEAATAVIPDLEALLEKTSGVNAWAVLDAISHFKTGAAPLIPALLRRGAEPDSAFHFRIAQTLVEVGADLADVDPLLIHLLASDKAHYNNCWQAGQLLTRIDPDEARRQVSRLIGKIAPRETEPMEHEDADLNALIGLGSQAHEAIPLLVRLLSHPSRSVRSLAMSSLGKLGPAAAPAVPKLLPLIDREPYAVQVLGDIGPAAQSAVPQLLKLMDVPHVRVYAARALGQIGAASPEILATLRRQLTKTLTLSGEDGDLPRVRVAAIQSLVLLAGDRPTTLTDVLSLLADNDRTVRAEAISAIGRLPGDRRDAIGSLIESLADDDPTIRTAAALALGRIGPDARAAVPGLQSLVADRRNAVTKSFQLWPDKKTERWVSLAEAAQWAISAIESPGMSPIK